MLKLIDVCNDSPAGNFNNLDTLWVSVWKVYLDSFSKIIHLNINERFALLVFLLEQKHNQIKTTKKLKK